MRNVAGGEEHFHQGRRGGGEGKERKLPNFIIRKPGQETVERQGAPSCSSVSQVMHSTQLFCLRVHCPHASLPKFEST